MFCLKCGEAIPDGSEVCPKCGGDPRESDQVQQEAVIYATSADSVAGHDDSVSQKKKYPSKGVWITIGALVMVACIIFVVAAAQVSNLKKQLIREWYAPTDSILMVLEFDDDQAEYRLETGYGWMDTTVFREPYKVVSGNSFQIKRFGDGWETYKVTFNDDKTIMTVTPAITSTDPSEKWYDIGD